MMVTKTAGFIPAAVVLLAATAACQRPNRETPTEGAGTTETRSGQVDAGAATQGTAQQQGSQQQPQGGDQGDKGATPLHGTVANLPPTEGTLAVRIEGGAPEKVDYAMKGDKIKLSVSSSPNNPKKGLDAIIDASERKATLLMKDQKKYAEVDLTRLAKMGGQSGAAIPKLKLTDTGETDTVAGTKCEMLRLQNAQYDVTACAVKGGPQIDLAALEKQGGFTAPAWLSQLVDEGYVPLRVNVKQKGGAPVVATRVTDFSHESLPDSEFAVPPDFTKTTLPGLPAPSTPGGNAKGKTSPAPNK